MVLVPGVLAFVLPSAMAATTVCTLRCEDLDDPLGIDAARPRLSWIVASDHRGQRQTAYQILVASTRDRLQANLADLWDSGKAASDATIQIAYGGSPLASRQACFWKVRVWDNDGRIAESKTARWEMGLVQPGDWQARWIGRTTDTHVTIAPLLRREFTLDGTVRQARAYICGLGYFELTVNGQRVGDHLLDPGYTRYDRRVLYVTHDVTGLGLRQGALAGCPSTPVPDRGGPHGRTPHHPGQRRDVEIRGQSHRIQHDLQRRDLRRPPRKAGLGPARVR